MSNQFKLLCCASLSFFTACSLVSNKKTEQRPGNPASTVSQAEVPNASQPEAVTLRPRVNLSLLQENGEFSSGFDRDLEGENHSYTSRTPIVIPHVVPSELRLSVRVPTFDLRLIRMVEINGQVGEQEGRTFPLQVGEFDLENPEDDNQRNINIRLRGIDQLFDRFAENHAFLNISLRGEGDHPATASVRVPIITPPSGIRAEQMTVAEYEREGRVVDAASKTLRTIDRTMSLLQVIRLRNPLPHAIIADFPLQPRGSLVTHYREVRLNQQPCTYTLNEREWDEAISNEFIIIPVDEERRLGFRDFVNNSISTGRFDFNIEPGSEKLLGIYAVGDSAQTLMTNGRASQVLSTTQAVISCRSRCGNPRTDMFHWDQLRQASAYWELLGWPGESRTCERLRNTTRILPETPHPDEDAMNRCALWELSNGTAPWDTHRFCQSPAPGNQWRYPHREFWNVERPTVNVSVGTQSSSIQLRLDPGSITVNLRYALTGNTETSPSRPINNLIQTSTVQFQ